MKFLLDQDVFAATAHFIKALGHDVNSAAEIGCSQATDIELLQIAQDQGRILITRDRDFGGLVFLRNLGTGVIYLRMLPSTLHECHEELKKTLVSHTEDELKRAFIVVEPGRHRFRKLSG